MILWAVAAMLLALVVAACGPKREILFNGENLDGWVYFTAEPDSTAPAPIEPVFSVVDGAIHISGTPNGYIRTEKKYSNFTLRLEWRWADRRKDSGIYVYLQDGDKVWPTGVQVQLRESDFGSLFSRIAMEGEDGPTYRKDPLCKEDPELADGEWNKVVVCCKNGKVTAKVNGVLVNEAVCAATAGYIGFQSEGGPIEFRNITVE